MAPRNNDPNTSYKRCYPVDSLNIQDMVPCILHKKHKVVKLVKSHIRKLRQEGLICAIAQAHGEESKSEKRKSRASSPGEGATEAAEGRDSSGTRRSSEDSESRIRNEGSDSRHRREGSDSRHRREGSDSRHRREGSDSRHRRENADNRHSRDSEGLVPPTFPNNERQWTRQPDDDPSRANDTLLSRKISPYFLLFLLEFLLLVFLMVYISAGPLSNSIAHTPVPPGSFIRTERPCRLEKKYLLRWSRPEYLE